MRGDLDAVQVLVHAEQAAADDVEDRADRVKRESRALRRPGQAPVGGLDTLRGDVREPAPRNRAGVHGGRESRGRRTQLGRPERRRLVAPAGEPAQRRALGGDPGPVAGRAVAGEAPQQLTRSRLIGRACARVAGPQVAASHAEPLRQHGGRTSGRVGVPFEQSILRTRGRCGTELERDLGGVPRVGGAHPRIVRRRRQRALSGEPVPVEHRPCGVEDVCEQHAHVRRRRHDPQTRRRERRHGRLRRADLHRLHRILLACTEAEEDLRAGGSRVVARRVDGEHQLADGPSLAAHGFTELLHQHDGRRVGLDPAPGAAAEADRHDRVHSRGVGEKRDVAPVVHADPVADAVAGGAPVLLVEIGGLDRDQQRATQRPLRGRDHDAARRGAAAPERLHDERWTSRAVGDQQRDPAVALEADGVGVRPHLGFARPRLDPLNGDGAGERDGGNREVAQHQAARCAVHHDDVSEVRHHHRRRPEGPSGDDGDGLGFKTPGRQDAKWDQHRQRAAGRTAPPCRLALLPSCYRHTP